MCKECEQVRKKFLLRENKWDQGRQKGWKQVADVQCGASLYPYFNLMCTCTVHVYVPLDTKVN